MGKKVGNRDRDKYYKLAKEQGYRARSAFKLIQLNRKYDFLSGCNKVIDLCAAPGGWMQVLAKTMPQTPDRQIIGVDIMPIKPVRGCVAFQNDITTEACRSRIRKELKGAKAEVVLCDGAPNVGADYTKDAFVQNELTVHALRFAADHLVKGGTFVTKVFRAADYNALMWSFNQLFKKVDATKPPSSRNVSAEIFVVCRGYLAPHKIDPRLLDPKHVLGHVDGQADAESGLGLMSEQNAMDKLFKHRDPKKKVRSRQGYEEGASQTLHRSVPAADFLHAKEPVKVLASASEITFKDSESKALLALQCTTKEVTACLEDLKVLANADLRAVLKWRVAAREALREQQPNVNKGQEEDAGSPQSDVQAESDGSGSSEPPSESEQDSDDNNNDDDDGDTEIADALERAKDDKRRKRKREEKKKRREQAKHQRRIDLGMENAYAIDLGEERGPFSARNMGVKSVKRLGEILEQGPVDLEALHAESENSSQGESEDEQRDFDAAEAREKYLQELEEQASYHHNVHVKKQDQLDPMTVRERRQQLNEAKKAKMKKKTLELKSAEDFEKAMQEEQGKLIAAGAYQDMLEKQGSSSEEESEDEDTGEKKEVDRAKADAVESKRAKRWFDQNIFEGAESDSDEQASDESDDESDDESADEDERSEGADDDESSQSAEDSMSSDDASTDHPLPSARTDKAKRAIKRAKLKMRNERKAEKRRLAVEREARAMDPDYVAAGFRTVKGTEDGNDSDQDQKQAMLKRKRKADADLEDLEDERPKSEKPRHIRDLIRKGMGVTAAAAVTGTGTGDGGKTKDFEVVPNNAWRDSDSDSDGDDPEEEKYNSEDYDTDERAQHLALGSMMVKKSTRRKLLDSGYNRFAFNDDTDALPDWFVQDENKHNRPQLPITREMVESVKARFKDLAAKPINKVAEARGRKKRRLETKVEKIKKQASAIAEEPDINVKSKMRQIEKLYKGANVTRPGAVYVVNKKSGGKSNDKGKSAGKAVKVVDKRMKADMGRLRGLKGKSKKQAMNKRAGKKGRGK